MWHYAPQVWIMVEVYYYVPADSAGDVLQCGISLSCHFDRELEIEGRMRRCLTALLNPKDDLKKYNNPGYSCIKIQILPKYCFVADEALYKIGMVHPAVMEEFMKSITPVEEYCFGSYRHPTCLLASSIIPKDISLLDKRIDSPVLFDNSEELYLNNIIETGKEKNSDFGDHLLYFFYDKLTELGAAEKYEDKICGLAAYLMRHSGKAQVVKIADLSTYLKSGEIEPGENESGAKESGENEAGEHAGQPIGTEYAEQRTSAETPDELNGLRNEGGPDGYNKI
jgi:hypothetical protein